MYMYIHKKKMNVYVKSTGLLTRRPVCESNRRGAVGSTLTLTVFFFTAGRPFLFFGDRRFGDRRGGRRLRPLLRVLETTLEVVLPIGEREMPLGERHRQVVSLDKVKPVEVLPFLVRRFASSETHRGDIGLHLSPGCDALVYPFGADSRLPYPHG